MASAHNQWMAAMAKVNMLNDEELHKELTDMLRQADRDIDKDREDHSPESMRKGLQLIRDVHTRMREAANL